MGFGDVCQLLLIRIIRQRSKSAHGGMKGLDRLDFKGGCPTSSARHQTPHDELIQAPDTFSPNGLPAHRQRHLLRIINVARLDRCPKLLQSLPRRECGCPACRPPGGPTWRRHRLARKMQARHLDLGHQPRRKEDVLALVHGWTFWRASIFAARANALQIGLDGDQKGHH